MGRKAINGGSSEALNILSGFALAVSIIALVVSVWGPINDFLKPGDIVPLIPAGFGIIRGMPDLGFPSDHIVLPLEWYNSWNEKTEIVSLPYLILHKNGSSETYRFFLAGEYPDTSIKSFGEPYSLERTFLFPPNSLSKHTLAFKIENWHNNTSKNYNFNFKPGDEYEVSIGFEQWGNGKFIMHQEVPLFKMLILNTVGNLSYDRGNYRSDYFDLNRTTGSSL